MVINGSFVNQDIFLRDIGTSHNFLDNMLGLRGNAVVESMASHSFGSKICPQVTNYNRQISDKDKKSHNSNQLKCIVAAPLLNK